MSVLFKIIFFIGISSTIVQLINGKFFGFGIILIVVFGFLGWRDPKNSILDSILFRKKLRADYPNFVRYVNTLSAKNIVVTLDTSDVLELSFPIYTFSKIMGQIHFGLKNKYGVEIYVYAVSNNGTVIKSVDTRLFRDLTVAQYKVQFDNIFLEFMSNPDYQNLTIGAYD